MADRIKGITIEIGGDTTKLDQSLKKVIGLVGTIMTLLPQLATFNAAVKTTFAALTAGKCIWICCNR